MRVHELAKELNLTGKELLAKIQDLGGSAKSVSSSVDEDLVPKIKTFYSGLAAQKGAASRESRSGGCGCGPTTQGKERKISESSRYSDCLHSKPASTTREIKPRSRP